MLQYSVAKPPQGAHPASSGLAGGGSGWRGGLCVRPILACTFSYYQHRPTQHCVGRGGPLATLGIMQGAAGDRGRGAAQLRGGHQASTISTREEPSKQDRRWAKKCWEESRGLGWVWLREEALLSNGRGGGGKADRQLPRNSLQSRGRGRGRVRGEEDVGCHGKFHHLDLEGEKPLTYLTSIKGCPQWSWRNCRQWWHWSDIHFECGKPAANGSKEGRFYW